MVERARTTLVVVTIAGGDPGREFHDLDVVTEGSTTVLTGAVRSDEAVFELLYRFRDAGLGLVSVRVHR